MGREGFLVPLKDFTIAKDRLRNGNLDATHIAKTLARGVLNELAECNLLVVTENPDVVTFASESNVASFLSAKQGLNEVVQDAYDSLVADFTRITIVHGDLRSPDGLQHFNTTSDVCIVTDRHNKGTNVLSLPTGLNFRFSYGEDSAQRHIAEAKRLGLRFEVITDSPWGHDVDVPEDIDKM